MEVEKDLIYFIIIINVSIVVLYIWVKFKVALTK